MDPTAVLVVTSSVVMLVTLIYVSSKTGYIVGIGAKNEPKFEIRKDRIRRFTCILGIVLLLNIVYGLVVTRDFHMFSDILMISAVNTLVIGWGLAYRVLLQEKKGESN